MTKFFCPFFLRRAAHSFSPLRPFSRGPPAMFFLRDFPWDAEPAGCFPPRWMRELRCPSFISPPPSIAVSIPRCFLPGHCSPTLFFPVAPLRGRGRVHFFVLVTLDMAVPVVLFFDSSLMSVDAGAFSTVTRPVPLRNSPSLRWALRFFAPFRRFGAAAWLSGMPLTFNAGIPDPVRLPPQYCAISAPCRDFG